MSCARGYGSGFRTTASTVLKSAVAAPMPIASVTLAVIRNDRWCMSVFAALANVETTSHLVSKIRRTSGILHSVLEYVHARFRFQLCLQIRKDPGNGNLRLHVSGVAWRSNLLGFGAPRSTFVVNDWPS